MNVDSITQMNQYPVFGPQQRVKWDKARPGGWTGDGNGKVVNFSPSRPFFGGPGGNGADTPGPAYEVELDGPLRFRIWAGPGELSAIE